MMKWWINYYYSQAEFVDNSKLLHDILRPCYRQVIKVQNPNLRIFFPSITLSPYPFPSLPE